MLAGQAAHDPLEQHRVVGGAQRIIDMHQVDLELSDAVFGNGGVGGHALGCTGGIDLLEEAAEVIEFVDRQNAIGIKALAGYR